MVIPLQDYSSPFTLNPCQPTKVDNLSRWIFKVTAVGHRDLITQGTTEKHTESLCYCLPT